MKKTIALGALLLLASVSPAYALTLTLENQSEWEVHELYFSAASESEWGPDQLGSEVIATGGSFDLHSIPKGKYDVKIVDEEGDECVVAGVDFNATEHFVLTDKLLIGCVNATAEEVEE